MIVREGRVVFVRLGKSVRVGGLEVLELELEFDVVVADETVLVVSLGARLEEDEVDLVGRGATTRHGLDHACVGVLRAPRGIEHGLGRAGTIDRHVAGDAVCDHLDEPADDCGERVGELRRLGLDDLLSEWAGKIQFPQADGQQILDLPELSGTHHGRVHGVSHGFVLSWCWRVQAKVPLPQHFKYHF